MVPHGMNVSLFNHSSVVGRLSYFQLWAITNKAAMSNHVQVFCVDINLQFSGKNAKTAKLFLSGCVTSHFH